ncbi:MAG TPA: hypothetical protein VLK30_10475 [Candidatus Limnocylindrales bacterium]|nr:hypothetical protein [Candidatus Limnocylindrales bacterium]
MVRNPGVGGEHGVMKRFLALVSVLSAAFGLAACGAAGLPAAAGTPSATSASPTNGQLHVAIDSDNGKTLNVRVGDRVEVRLSSTYWIVSGSSDSRVLKAEGPAVVSPRPSGCVPGGGCGTVDVVFDVVGPGAAYVVASRDSCGEAMRCTGGAGSYRLAVEALS